MLFDHLPNTRLTMWSRSILLFSLFLFFQPSSNRILPQVSEFDFSSDSIWDFVDCMNGLNSKSDVLDLMSEFKHSDLTLTYFRNDLKEIMTKIEFHQDLLQRMTVAIDEFLFEREQQGDDSLYVCIGSLSFLNLDLYELLIEQYSLKKEGEEADKQLQSFVVKANLNHDHAILLMLTILSYDFYQKKASVKS